MYCPVGSFELRHRWATNNLKYTVVVLFWRQSTMYYRVSWPVSANCKRNHSHSKHYRSSSRVVVCIWLSDCTCLSLLQICLMCSSKSIYTRRGKESVVLRITTYKRTLKSAKVKLCNIAQNIPLTSGTITASTLVVKTSKLRAMDIACICVCGHHLHTHMQVLVVTILHNS